MRPRIERELQLLRQVYSVIEHAEAGGEDWFKIGDYPLPAGWRLGDSPITEVPVAFKLSAGYPITEPYGFLAPERINFGGVAPNNTCPAASAGFAGSWVQFSWAPEGTWAPNSEIHLGSNLLSWVRSFAQRLKEGP
jgi:hypothetical protein